MDVFSAIYKIALPGQGLLVFSLCLPHRLLLKLCWLAGEGDRRRQEETLARKERTRLEG